MQFLSPLVNESKRQRLLDCRRTVRFERLGIACDIDGAIDGAIDSDDVTTAGAADIEIGAGVVIERRWLLRGALGLASCAVWPKVETVSAQEPKAIAASHTNLESLLANVRPAAVELVRASSPDEETYLEAVSLELQRAGKFDVNQFHSGGKDWEMDLTAYVPPILLYQIRMQPNSVIELHDHRFHNGVLSVREGSVRVRNFDIYQENDKETWDVAAGHVPAVGVEFTLQEKPERKLRAGETSSLTRTMNNIHQVEAGPDGCLLYDLFTNFQRNAQSFRIQWDGKYIDSSRKQCRVMWIPPDHTHED